ncbi:MAG TPA: hypothetical protein VK856_00120 [Anaerolineaceae bacterium]|nr:hypothetical protein [Anaerolineaceae bacterium]
MKMNYSPKDWQLLSNYLDRQLSNQEVLVVEQRLSNEPDLRQILQEMQQTRYLLQHAKKLPVPRSFTLTPDMAANIRPAKKPLIPFFSFASVIATIFLVVVLLIDFLPGVIQGGMMAKSQNSNDLVAMESAPMMAADSREASEPPMIIEWGSPEAKGLGGGTGGMDPEMAAGLPMGGGVDNPPYDPEMPVEEPAQPVEEPPMPEEEPLLGIASEELKSGETEPITGAGPILGIRSADETDAFNDSVLSILQESSDDPIPTLFQPFPWLRFSQILLGGFAIIFAITAFILRKRSF